MVDLDDKQDMTASNLVVPLVLWGRQAPTHCISSILMTPDMRRIVTGCNDGQIIAWDVDANAQVRPRNMLLGHTAAVTCMAMGHLEKHYLVSATDNGELSLWDLVDGRCIEHTKSENVHTNMTSYPLLHCRGGPTGNSSSSTTAGGEVRLVCHGYYADILILHPLTLEPVFSLASRIQPDWISALCVLRPVKREDDVVVAITNSGTVKVWTISAAEVKLNTPLYEDESKQIRCLNAQTLRCCAYNQRTVLIVCSKYWQIYDAGDFSLLCSESARCGERWAGGEFISVDRVCVWSNEGKGYLYKLPTNVNPESEHYRKHPHNSQMAPQAYTVLDLYTEKPLECSPSMIYFHGRRGGESKLLLRGDSEGRIVVWSIPDIKESHLRLHRQESFERLPAVQPRCMTSLSEQWASVSPKPEGLIDQLNKLSDRDLEITASIYIPSQGRLVCGRDDGSIVIVPAVEAIILQLLNNGKTKDSLPHRVLHGHRGRVNCLLYPASEDARYDPNHLLSGGVDFTVLLWDISTGSRLHTYCVHGGEITQLLVPPATCNPRILPSIASVASDHSLALLSLKERKCILLAGRQLFPIQTVKWRPHDDFLIIGCTDGTVYVWQMETGHLDRVVHGVTAEEILSACDEKSSATDVNLSSDLTNPSISLTQAFRRHNIATFKNFAQQTLQKAQEVGQVLNAEETGGNPVHHPSLVHRSHSAPMLVSGLRTNLKDPDSHIVYFDTEALIVSLLSEEYAAMSPTTLAALGFFVAQAKDQNLSDTQKKMVDLLSKAKDKAEKLGNELQAKAESAGLAPVSPNMPRKKPPRPHRPPKLNLAEPPSAPSLVLEIAQVLMSCLHAWGLDSNLDSVCRSKLGLLPPTQPISFGLLSRHNHCSLLLPGWHRSLPSSSVGGQISNGHWQISSPVTTQHLLSVISIANTLMSMTHATFMPGQQNRAESGSSPEGVDPTQQAQTKQGWSLLATLHCVLLPDLIGQRHFKPPLLEMLGRRWQDRCLEVRDAAQALLLAELRRIGASGRKQVVEDWSPYLPSYVDPSLSILSPASQHDTGEGAASMEDNDDAMLGESGKLSQSFESRRKQATAIVMMGVLGAEFGGEIEPSKNRDSQNSNVAEGFGLKEYSHAMHTSKALTFLLLTPASPRLPAHSPIRRAAVDLLGRGFTVWQPYLDVSAVLIGLLDLCVDGDKLVPSMTFGLPLCPPADACRTARHALSLIATARPPAFVITMAKEVARHNAIAQNSQAQHHNNHQLQNSPLVRAKTEIIRIVELLIEKMPIEVIDLLVDVMDVLVHCLDAHNIKTRGLHEVFPQIFKFTMVGYCQTTRKVCTGAKNGGLAFYDLKASKCQVLPGHTGPTIAVAFSPDGKHLASYCLTESKLLFWQIASTSLFGIGNQPTKCIKTFATPPFKVLPAMNPLKLAKLVWVDKNTVVLITADRHETRYRV